MPFWNRKPSPAVVSAFEPSQARRGPAVRRPVPPSLASVRNIVAVGSGKGGVGKSTVTANLAVALQKLGARVAVMDADIYGPSQPRLLGAGAQKADLQGETLVPLVRHGVGFMSVGLLMGQDGPVVWRAPMAVKLIQDFIAEVSWGDLDYLLVDMPPGTGDVQLTLAQQAALTGAVIVTTPQDVALGIAKKGLQMFQQVKVPVLGVVENMSGFHCRKCGERNLLFKEGGGKRLAEETGVPFLGALPLDPGVVESGDEGVPLLVKSPDAPAARAFLDLASAFEREVARANAAGAVGEPSRVEIVRGGAGLSLVWPDGHQGHHTARRLRVECPCAACVNETTGQRTLDPRRVPGDIKIQGSDPVGRYGLALRFSDGHGTGIYTFERLRGLCECGTCGEGRPPIPAPELPAAAPSSPGGEEALRRRVLEVLERRVNPGVASHGGRVDLAEIKGAKVYLRMSGGCQGCASAQATLKQGVERTFREEIPEIEEVVDVTDHSAGSRPYFKQPGQSPLV